MSLTYPQALIIANALSTKTTKPATLLNQMIERTGRAATFVIMRYGDPANWRELPTIKRGRPAKTDMTAFGRRKVSGPFAIRHLKTGQLVTADTIRDLAVKAGLEDTLANQRGLGHVVTGRHHSLYDWYLAPVLDQTVELKDPYGNEYKPMTVRELALSRGVSPGSSLSLISGKKRFLGNGLCLKSTTIESVLRPRNWRFSLLTAKVGRRTVKAASIPKLADKLGVSPCTLYPLAYGFKERSDIQLTDIQIERKSVLPELAGTP